MWDHIINIHLSKLLSTKTKESKINEFKKKNASQYQKLRINKKKWTIYIFLPNNILTRFFKGLTKYKNDYILIVFKLYIYIYI